MVRPGKIDVANRMLRIDCVGGSVSVHRHLLSECSQEWEDQLKMDYEVDAGLSVLDTKTWADPDGGLRRWQLYIGFVYGNPIWTRSEAHSLEHDFLQLAIIYDHFHFNEQDRDAADAAMDAMRKIVTQNADELSNPFELLRKSHAIEGYHHPWVFILDFMVYGASDSVFGKWYNAFKAGLISGIDGELSERFAEKAELGLKGQDMPDFMERCRYHDHDLDDDRCYLDK